MSFEAAERIPYDVVVWVYDLSNGMAKSMSMMFLGRQIEAIYHTGVVVYGSEYFFGGGIAADRPGSTQAGAPLRKVKLGTTNKTQEEFHAFLQSVGDQYTMAKYNVLSHNCNNFAAACTEFLLGDQDKAKKFPQEILDLPSIVLSTPMGAMFRPMLESIGPNSQNSQAGGAGFIPMAQGHLQLPPSIHNTPPQSTVSSPVAAAPVTTTTTTTTGAETTPPQEFKLKFNDHRITSLSTLEELPYHILTTVPAAFPSVQHDADRVIKMFALIQASYKNPALTEHLSTPRIVTAQETIQKTVTQLLGQMKGKTTSEELLKQKDYISTLKALQNISQPYETSAILGNLGLFTILLCQFNLETLLITQRSIESDHVDTQGHALHHAAKELIVKTGDNDVTFDAFVEHVVQLYQNDILPQIAPTIGEDGKAIEPKVIFKAPVLKLLRTTFEQFFHVVMSTALTPSSQLSILRLSGLIIDQYWSKCTAIENTTNNNDTLPVIQTNDGSVLEYALKLMIGYLATLKTDNSQRPPKFFPSRAIKEGIVDGNKDAKGADEEVKKAKIEEINDFLTDFYVTGVLKLQEVFVNALPENSKVNLNVISGVEYINYLFYIVAYIANGTQEHCQLLLSLDFVQYETMHKWFDVITTTFKLINEKKIVLDDEKLSQVSNLVQLLEDFDAITVIGNRERFW